MTEPKKNWLDRNMPTREGLAANRYMRPFSHRVLRSELWRFTRRSVPRGVALGLFAGFIVPIGKIFLAAFLALPARANVPIAMMMTSIANPFTLPFWILVANKVGAFILRVGSLTGEPMAGHGSSSRWEWFDWFLKEAGFTAIGFIALSIVSAAIGYLVSSWLWTWRVKNRRKRRLAQAANSK